MQNKQTFDYLSFLNTNDGSTGLYNSDVDDIYHSVYGAKEEAEEKFIKPLCFEKNFLDKKQIRVLDICYGIGYNTKAFLKKILQTKYNGNVLIDALEYDKNLVLISPFIKDGYFNSYPEISYLLSYSLFDEIHLSNTAIKDIIISDTNKRFFTPFYRRLIKRFKHFSYRYNPQCKKQAFLHNIYYHFIMTRYKIMSKPMYSMKPNFRNKFYISRSLYY